MISIAAGMMMAVVSLACEGKEKMYENPVEIPLENTSWELVGIVDSASYSCWTKQIRDTCSISTLFLKDVDTDQIYHDTRDQTARIVYFSKSDTTYVYQRHDTFYDINKICNFPKLAKQWANGVTVYLVCKK